MPSDVTELKEAKSAPSRENRTILVVSGMSGAGKTSTLKTLEDMGFEAIDNVPLAFLPALLAAGEAERAPARVAVGIDARTRDFRPHAFMAEIERLKRLHPEMLLLFLDCDDDELRRRYSETRHRHPLAQDRPVSDGIQLEREMMAGIRTHADIVLDTTGLGPSRLKGILRRHLGERDDAALTIFVVSFSYRRGLPREADLVLDVRFLANPHYQDDLRPLTGRDAAVQTYIRNDKGYAPFFERLEALFTLLLPSYSEEGKSYLTIAFGCTGGKHRSVFVAEDVAEWLERQGYRVSLRHREMERDGNAAE